MTTTEARTITENCARCGGSGIYSRFHGVCFGCGGSGRVTVTVAAVKARKAREAKAVATRWAGREDWTVEDFIAANTAEVAAGTAYAGPGTPAENAAATREWAVQVCARKNSELGR